MAPEANSAEKQAAQTSQSKNGKSAEQGTNAPGTRTDSFLFGIPQLGLSHVDREVPLDEPPPMPANAGLQYIGRPTPRYDGAAKVSGQGKYTADIHLPGMLYARIAGAKIP